MKKNNQILTEEHHRRARSVGGTKTLDNISYVKKKQHESWHILFGNMNAFQIANRINQMNQSFKPKRLKIICKFINGSEVTKQGGNNSKDKALVLSAWKYLSYGMGFRKFIGHINNMWLDPSYHFYIEETEEVI